MALVEFTQRAEQSLLEILGKTKRLEEALLVVDLKDQEAQLSVEPSEQLAKLQQDIDLVGPFKVALGGEPVRLFVREPDTCIRGHYELDYYSCGGRNCFQIRERAQD